MTLRTAVLLGLLAGDAAAAPPALTSLYPAGAKRGTTAEVTAAGTFDVWPARFWTSDKRLSVAPGKAKGTLSVIVAPDAPPGVYWLRAHSMNGASAPRPFVVGTLPEAADAEPNDDARKPQAVTPPVTVNGRLEKANDVDCFAVPLKKGQTLVAAVDAHQTFRSPMDAVLQVASADGFVLDRNHDAAGLDPRLAFTAPADGTYVVRLFAFPATPDTSIRLAGGESYVYRLTLTTGAFADHAWPLAVAAPGDPVELAGWNVPAGLAPKVVAGPTDGNPFATLAHPNAANPVRVRVEGHPCHAAPVGGPLAVPCSVSARLPAPGAEATIPLRLSKGKPVTIQAEAQPFGRPVAPVLRVLDSAGKQLGRAEPAKPFSDSTLSFTPPADGVFAVVVSDLYAAGGPRSAVLLRALTPTPDYELTVAADRFAVPPGKPLDVPVKVVRKAGFAGPVEVVAEGLPGSFRCEVKPPAGKPDPNTVVVTLTAEKPGAGGAFRLVGKTAGGPSHAARAPLAEFDTTTADLWVAATETPVPPPPAKKK